MRFPRKLFHQKPQTEILQLNQTLLKNKIFFHIIVSAVNNDSSIPKRLSLCLLNSNRRQEKNVKIFNHLEYVNEG